MRSNRAVSAGRGPDVAVFGQVARDLVLLVDAMPGPGQSAGVCQRRELLGGQGANQAVALAQLGMRPALAGAVGAVGENYIGQSLLIQARRDRVDAATGGRPGLSPRVVEG
jgi:ribokinase